MKAVVTVIGLDSVGILARVSSVCAEHNANVIDVTQSVMQKLFTMIMLIDISDLNSDFAALQSSFNALGEEIHIKRSHVVRGRIQLHAPYLRKASTYAEHYRYSRNHTHDRRRKSRHTHYYNGHFTARLCGLGYSRFMRQDI